MKQLFLNILMMAAISQLNAQNVGIGTATPAEKLEVNGNLRFTFGEHKFISVSTAPSQSSQGNNLTISAGSLSPQALSGVGGNLELQGGNLRNPGAAGGNIFITVGRNSYADGSSPVAKHGFIVFRGGTSTQGQTIVEHARMDGTTGNWGFGTTTPTSRVDVAGTGGLHVNTTNPGTGASDWIAGNFGGTAGDRVVMGILSSVASIGAHNNALNAWDDLAINPGGGNVGIGTTNPVNKLSVAGTMDVAVSLGIGLPAPHASLHLAPIISNRRIILWEDANNDHQFFGLGINPSVLRYQVPGTGASHIFFAGTSGSTSVELMRIQGDGRVGIGTAPSARLDVNGNFKLGNAGSVLNNVIKFDVGLGVVPVGANNSAAISVGPIGAAVTGSTVYLSPSAPLPAGMSIGFARVPVNGTVELVFVNGTNANQNIPAMTFYVTIIN